MPPILPIFCLLSTFQCLMSMLNDSSALGEGGMPVYMSIICFYSMWGNLGSRSLLCHTAHTQDNVKICWQEQRGNFWVYIKNHLWFFFLFLSFPPPPKKLIPLLPPLHNLEDFTIIWIGWQQLRCPTDPESAGCHLWTHSTSRSGHGLQHQLIHLEAGELLMQCCLHP